MQENKLLNPIFLIDMAIKATTNEYIIENVKSNENCNEEYLITSEANRKKT